MPALLDLFDPRGRCNRRGLAFVALALLGVQAGVAVLLWATQIGFTGPLAIALKLIFLWAAIAAAAKRLHDTGRSAWCILWTGLAVIGWSITAAIGLLLAYGEQILVPGSTGQVIHFALTMLPMLPVLAVTLWLHFAPGDLSANRYGPCPCGIGYSAPHPRPQSAEVNVPGAAAA